MVLECWIAAFTHLSKLMQCTIPGVTPNLVQDVDSGGGCE